MADGTWRKGQDYEHAYSPTPIKNPGFLLESRDAVLSRDRAIGMGFDKGKAVADEICLAVLFDFQFGQIGVPATPDGVDEIPRGGG